MLEERIAMLIGAIDALNHSVRTLDERMSTVARLGDELAPSPQHALPLPLPLPADAPPPPMAEAQVVTLNDLRTALLACGRDRAREILRAAGVDLLRDLPQAQYAVVLAQAKEARGA